MHHVLIILTLTVIQGHADLDHEIIKCLIISATIQAMAIKFAAKIHRLKLYMTIASPMTLTFILDHKCVSNLQYLGQFFRATKFKVGMMVDLWMSYMFMLVSVILTSMQGHSGSAKATNQC